MITTYDLSKLPDFDGVPEEQLEWMLENGEYLTVPEGDYIFKPGEDADHLQILMSGKMLIYAYLNEQKRELGEFESPYITGLLPFSRMEKAAGYGQVVVDSVVFRLHRSKFREMVAQNYELTQSLVRYMTTRVRSFTSQRLQEEKMMSLGKLSAGLAHELNNPASAVVRSSSELIKHLHLVPESFKKVMMIDISPEEVDTLSAILFERMSGYAGCELSVLKRGEQEDELADFLEDNGLEDGFELAPELVEFSFGIDDLRKIREIAGEKDFPVIMQWIVSNLTTEKMVNDIEEASRRISDLISSIKTYTHMDQSQDKQELDVLKGLQTTLTMLGHKIKKNDIQIKDDHSNDLPRIHGYPGQINQVFTNLIDNAIDAMEEGGTLTLASGVDSGKLWVCIQDSGPGIPEDVKSRIFDPFFTTKEAGKGTGMGLEVVKKILDSHQAKIHLESEPGKTVFKIIFPVDHGK